MLDGVVFASRFVLLQLRDLEARLLQERDEKAVLAGAAAACTKALTVCGWVRRAFICFMWTAYSASGRKAHTRLCLTE